MNNFSIQIPHHSSIFHISRPRQQSFSTKKKKINSPIFSDGYEQEIQVPTLKSDLSFAIFSARFFFQSSVSTFITFKKQMNKHIRNGVNQNCNTNLKPSRCIRNAEAMEIYVPMCYWNPPRKTFVVKYPTPRRILNEFALFLHGNEHIYVSRRKQPLLNRKCTNNIM